MQRSFGTWNPIFKRRDKVNWSDAQRTNVVNNVDMSSKVLVIVENTHLVEMEI